MKTEYIRPQDVIRSWHLVNAAGVPMGRVASTAARVLMGKHKALYSPHVDCGDHVIIINAADVALTGRKWEQKHWFRHSGYLGSIRQIPYAEIMKKDPERVIRKVVDGMLPKNRLGRQMIRRLRIFAQGEHPHVAQKPQMLEVR